MKIKLGIPTGSLEKATIDLFRRAGFVITTITMPIRDASCPNLTSISERTPAAVLAGFLLFYGINV